MTVLVTGGAGYIGRHLVDALAENGHGVRVFDRVPVPGLNGVVGDVTDRAAVDAALDGVAAVVHLAGIGVLWRRDPDDYRRVNVDGTRIVADAARAAGVRRFVHVSSATVLVGADVRRGTMVDERDRPPETAMIGAYCRTKHRAEAVVDDAGLAEPVIVLPTAPIGPGHDPGGARSTEPMAMLCDLLAGRTPAYLDCTLDLIDVRDLAAAIAAALTAPPDRYVLAGHGVAFPDLLATLATVSGRRMPRRRVPLALALTAARVQEAMANRSGRPPQAAVAGVRLAGKSVRYDAARARARLGLAPRPLAETLADTTAWLAKIGQI